MIDANAYIGQYPFRYLPHPDPEILATVLSREGLTGAWVGHLPTAFHRDPSPGNDALFKALEAHPTLRPVPSVRPDWPQWERALAAGVDRGVPAVRAYPPQWGLGPDDPGMRALAEACGDARVALVLTARFEDLRQRHWLDQAGDLTAAAIRNVARNNRNTRIIVCSAGRGTIEEVHWGLTPDERERVWWDISWVWGPPEDELAILFRTVGSRRFVYGTAWPLRLAQTPRANLALLPDDVSGATLTDLSTW